MSTLSCDAPAIIVRGSGVKAELPGMRMSLSYAEPDFDLASVSSYEPPRFVEPAKASLFVEIESPFGDELADAMLLSALSGDRAAVYALADRLTDLGKE